jgi:hypothetical protein
MSSLSKCIMWAKKKSEGENGEAVMRLKCSDVSNTRIWGEEWFTE